MGNEWKDQAVKVKGEYVLREIAGDYILIPIGETALEMNGMITMDEVGVTIWKCLEQEMTEDEILREILDNFEVEENVAREDLTEFLEKLKEANLAE